MAESGQLALPSFQRSYVWKNKQSVADYLSAVFRNRPTGIFLVLKTNGKPQFPVRTIRGVEADPGQAEELVLDGQQRLTSLWDAFNGNPPVRYYIEVADLKGEDISVVTVDVVPDASARGRAMAVPKAAYECSLVPVSILRHADGERGRTGSGLGLIWDWCARAVEGSDNKRRLENTIRRLREQLLLTRDLHYCELPAQTDREIAIDIFVQSNKSSVRVNEFDIAVALAMERGEEDLRDRILDFYENSTVLGHYVDGSDADNESAIAPVGESLLFAACLRVLNVVPKKQRFEKVIVDVLKSGKEEGNSLLQGLLQDLESVYTLLSYHGAPTRRTLPSRPPVHVLTALQDTTDALTKSTHQGLANRLISSYLWRSFFSDRYEVQANDRLFLDYSGLRTCLEQIEAKGTFDESQLPPIFDDEACQLPSECHLSNLDEPLPWIMSASRLGRALAALFLAGTPTDWVTSKKLDVAFVRELSMSRTLDRHHIFPVNVLVDTFSREQAYHGLNGVFLSKGSNQSLSKKDPKEYMAWMVERTGGSGDGELKEMLRRELVPYDAIMATGSLRDRYTRFIRERARLVSERIDALTRLPSL